MTRPRGSPTGWRFFWSTLGFLLLLFVSIAFNRSQDAPPSPLEIGKWEADPQVWGRLMPEQYERWILSAEDYGMTEFGGSKWRNKLEENPRLRILYAGSPYAQDYNEERGHPWSLQDLLSSDRLGTQKPGACLSCKSGTAPRFLQQMGTEAFDNARLSSLVEQGAKHPVSCINCHPPKAPDRLRFYLPALREALESRKIDPAQLTDSDLRVYVCAQCHSDYYFRDKTDKTLLLGWRQGTQFAEIEKLYDQMDYADWVHPDTGARLVKIQHPEYELWSSGLHARRGVSCVDCHMPLLRREPKKVSDHWIRSPLMDVKKSCLSSLCHDRYSEGELKREVLLIQKRTYQLKERAETALIDAIQAIKAAVQAGVPEEDLELAREWHRKAHLRWDFIASENSMGFHSPQESARLLGEAIDFARSAQLEAVQAVERQKASAAR